MRLISTSLDRYLHDVGILYIDNYFISYDPVICFQAYRLDLIESRYKL